MPSDGIGFSFQPGAVDRMSLSGPGGVGANTGPTNPQEIVKLLELRLPKRPAPGQIAPTDLFAANGPTGFGRGSLNALLMALMQKAGQSGPDSTQDRLVGDGQMAPQLQPLALGGGGGLGGLTGGTPAPSFTFGGNGQGSVAAPQQAPPLAPPSLGDLFSHTPSKPVTDYRMPEGY
jgi:hypothetical protein